VGRRRGLWFVFFGWGGVGGGGEGLIFKAYLKRGE